MHVNPFTVIVVCGWPIKQLVIPTCDLGGKSAEEMSEMAGPVIAVVDGPCNAMTVRTMAMALTGGTVWFTPQ
jgi:hypothetical protein